MHLHAIRRAAVLACAVFVFFLALFVVSRARADETTGEFFIRQSNHPAFPDRSVVKRSLTTGAPMRLSGAAMLDEARRYLGAGNPTGFRGAWCGAFMAMIARQTGHAIPANPLLARSWARAGRPTDPAIGAVAVMPHHVGQVVALEPGRVKLLGGNQRHRVTENWYPTRRFIAFREV